VRPALRHAAGAMLLALLAIAPASTARAQETQVPIDRAGRIERIDARLAARVGLFTGRYPGFQEARLFRAADSSLVLEITTIQKGQLTRERLPLSAAGADSLRARVTMLVGALAPSAAVNQEGRVWLLVSSTLLGVSFYGWALPVATDMTDGQVIAGTYLLTAGGSFFLPFAATGTQPVSYGMTNLALYGMTRGIVHGVLIHDLATGPEGGGRGATGAAMGASIVEGVAGYAWARKANLSSGAATTIANLGDFGLLNALGASNLADYYDTGRQRDGSAVMLLGSAAGMFGGAQLAAHRAYSYGDATVMRDAILLGVFAGLMVTDWSVPEGHKPFIQAAMVGSVVGLAAGDFLVRDTEFTNGQSVMVTLGTLAGAAVGLGFGNITTSHIDDNGRYLMTASMVGSALGFAATYRSFLREAKRAQTDRSSWRLELSPAALAVNAPGVYPLRIEYRY
jgi:hypothetical protein